MAVHNPFDRLGTGSVSLKNMFPINGDAIYESLV
jgi:hypothetical protein